MFNMGNGAKNLLVKKEEKNKYYDENIKIELKNDNDSHSIIAAYVKDGSECLDVGCAVGYIGEVLKEEKKCKMYGIEIDNEVIKIKNIKIFLKKIKNMIILYLQMF